MLNAVPCARNVTQLRACCRLGNVEAAAHAVCFQVWLASSLLVDSLAVAAQALIGQNASINPTQALVVAQRALTWGVRLGCTLALGLVVTRTYIPHLFSADAAMYGLAVQVLWWVALLQPVNALAFVWDGILYGVNGFKYASAVATFPYNFFRSRPVVSQIAAVSVVRFEVV